MAGAKTNGLPTTPATLMICGQGVAAARADHEPDLNDAVADIPQSTSGLLLHRNLKGYC